MFEEFYHSLTRRKTDDVFNPWFDIDIHNDLDSSSPEKRLNNLKHYLKERSNAKYLFVAEALGYQGGHFSGIPMTSERIILGHKICIGVLPTHVSDTTLERSSKVILKKDGFTEPTATIVWQKLVELNYNTRDFVFWNAFPWHPYNNSSGFLSNRTPTVSEIREGKIVLNHLLQSIQFKKIIALGNESYDLLTDMKFNVTKVRHPANGGASLFREQIKNMVEV